MSLWLGYLIGGTVLYSVLVSTSDSQLILDHARGDDFALADSGGFRNACLALFVSCNCIALKDGSNARDSRQAGHIGLHMSSDLEHSLSQRRT